jgi:hypothetical protein
MISRNRSSRFASVSPLKTSAHPVALPPGRLSPDSVEHCWTKPLQRVNLTPMSRYASTIQSSRSRQKERAGTHRCDAWHAINRPGYDVCYGSARKFLSHTGLAANRDESVGAREALIRDLRERHISDKSNAGRGWKWSSLGRSDLDAIYLARQRIVGTGKHLEGTSDIQQLAIREREHQNVVRRGHRLTLALAPLGLKAKDQSIRANGPVTGFMGRTPGMRQCSTLDGGQSEHMSAGLPPKADIGRRYGHGSFVPTLCKNSSAGVFAQPMPRGDIARVPGVASNR